MTDRISADDVHVFDDQPRILDLRLAEALGFAQPRDIRKLIDRNLDELESYGEICATVAQTADETAPSRGGFADSADTAEENRATVARFRPARGPAGKMYHLTEPQALLVCMFARTPNAAEVRRELVRVFMEWRARTLPPPAASAVDGGGTGWRDRPYGYDVPPPEPFRLTDGRELSRADTELSLAIMRLWRHSADSPKMLELWRLLGLPMPEMAPPAVAPGRSHAGLDCLLYLLGCECGEGNPLVQTLMVMAYGGDAGAGDILLEHGMCVMDGGILVTNSHPFILSLFSRSPWRGGGHSGALRTLPGCYPAKKRLRGGAWRDEARGTVVPIRLIEEPVMAAA